MTFPEYIKENYGHRAADHGKDPFDLLAYDILHDETFPVDETDGLLVRSYIRNRQGFPISKRTERGNRLMIQAFEDLWLMYKFTCGKAA